MGGVKFGNEDAQEGYPQMTRGMLERGEDPKEIMIEFCKPECSWWKGRLERCELALKNLTHADPSKTCMYPARDWITCLEGCVSIFQ